MDKLYVVVQSGEVRGRAQFYTVQPDSSIFC